MAPLDVSGLSFFMPLFGFLFVFLVVFAILSRTKILGDNKFIQIFVGFIIAIIFVTVSSVRSYVEAVVPWFAVLLVILFFVLMIIGFSQSKMESMMKPSLAWVFIVLLIIIFLVAAINVFSPTIGPYLPGGSRSDEGFFGFLYSSQVVGAILLLGIGALVAWAITRK